MKSLLFKSNHLLSWFRKNFSQQDVLFILLFSALYFTTRLINILQMPVFVDEGNYIIWAKQVLIQKSYFITLTDGKPPLPTWGAAAFIYLTPMNMLLGLRLFSIFCGYISVIGFFLLSHLLFDKKTALVSTFLYIFTPFILFYDRLGIVDTFANTTSIFVLICSIILIRKGTFWSAILFGVTCGIGLLVKSNIWIYIYLSLCAPLLTLSKKNLSISIVLKETVKFIILYILALLVAEGIYNLQLLSSYPNALELIQNKNQDFLYPLQELLANPFGLFFKNVPERIGDLMQMTGWIAFIVALLGFIHLYLKKRFLSLYLFIWFAAPLFAITYLVKYFAARYMIFIATMIILIAGYFVSNIKNKYISLILFLFILGSFIYIDLPFLMNYHKLNFPRFEREQYIEGIGSGYGIKEIVAKAQNDIKVKPVIIIGEGIFGLGSYIVESAVPMYQKNIEVIGLWPFTLEGLKSFQPQLAKKKIYIVLNGQTIKKVPANWPLRLIKKYKKPYNTEYFVLYELTNK